MEYELYHHGIKGQKWGVRRYQPYPAGHQGGKEIGRAAKPSKQMQRAQKKAARSNGEDEQITTKKKTSRKERGKMSEEELANRIKRLEKETKLKDLEKKNMDDGEEYAKDILRSVGKKVAVQGGAAVGMLVLYRGMSGLSSEEFRNSKGVLRKTRAAFKYGKWPENPGGFVPKPKDKY